MRQAISEAVDASTRAGTFILWRTTEIVKARAEGGDCSGSFTPHALPVAGQTDHRNPHHRLRRHAPVQGTWRERTVRRARFQDRRVADLEVRIAEDLGATDAALPSPVLNG
jgi:hypothetical protein